jgi:hypothetical protein
MLLTSILVSFLTLCFLGSTSSFTDEKSYPTIQLNSVGFTDLRLQSNKRQQSAPTNLPVRSAIAEINHYKFKLQRADKTDSFLGASLVAMAALYIFEQPVIYFAERLIARPSVTDGARAPPF